MNLILFGPPGAGKGTQSQKIVKNYKYIQISTGDLLRNEIKKDTNLGKKINNKISKGEFVEDELVNSLIVDVVSNENNKNKIIFDGYPRNISQAKKLDDILLNHNQTIGAIIYLDVSREVIKKRILGIINNGKTKKNCTIKKLLYFSILLFLIKFFNGVITRYIIIQI